MVASYLKPDSELHGELSAVCKGSTFMKGAAPTNTTARLSVGTDLFEFKRDHYLLAVDYFSRYPEIYKLSSTTSNAIIAVLKCVFARHGIPEVLRSDTGPQYASKEFSEFVDEHNIQHVTSSPHFPQSNGQVERMVQTMKGLLKQSADPHLAVLSYRATPCNAMVWFESVRAVHGSKDQNHSTTDHKAAYSQLVLSPTVQEQQPSVHRKSIMTSDMESKTFYYSRWIKSCDDYRSPKT